MAENMDRELGWDDEIENTSQYVDIPDGEYEFIVDHYERSKVGSNSEKYAGKNMAVVYCAIQAPGAEPVISTNLILHSKFQWKLAQFFRSIRLMKDEEGAKLKMEWNKVPGLRGWCKVVHKPNYNDATKTHLEIDEFLPPRKQDFSKGF